MTERPEIGMIYEYGHHRVKILQNDVRHMSMDSRVCVIFEDLDNGYLYGMDLHEFNSKYAERKKQKVANNYAKESAKPFTLSDLESGMVVECENGIRYLVVGQDAYRHGGWNKLSCYNENLTTRPEHRIAGYDIVRVFKPLNVDIIDALSDSYKLGELIWQREPEIKEVTLDEIAKKFGVEVNRLRIKE